MPQHLIGFNVLLSNFEKMNRRSLYRTILPWALLFIYFLGNMRVVVPYLEYKINYDFISEVLCINKNKPDLQCLGKCHLTKELGKAAEEDAKKKETSSNQLIEVEPAEVFVMTFASTATFIEKEKYFYLHPVVLSGNPEHNTPPPKA